MAEFIRSRFYRAHSHAFHIVGSVIVVALFAWLAWEVYVPAPKLGVAQEFRIEKGQGLSVIASNLSAGGLVRNRFIFMLYVSVLGWEKNLKAGDYLIPAGAAMDKIAAQIAGNGALPTDIEVFLPEGSNIWETDKRLADVGLVREGYFTAAYQPREGYLFPDTYRFDPKTLPVELDLKMEANGDSKTEQLMGGLSAFSKQRVIIIASIIEKEARTPQDMRFVSGVIKNRLAKGMPLEIDATVAYGACLRQFERDTSKDCLVQNVNLAKEVSVDSAYNTYTRAGLPAGPISNPGLDAIEAALDPQGNYLYYLSDSSGTIHFETTATQHEADRKKYLGL